MSRNFFIAFLLSLALALPGLSGDAGAQGCGKRPCSGIPRGLSDRDRLPPGLSERGNFERFLPPGLSKQRRRERARRKESYETDPSYYGEDLFVQSNPDRGRLIGPTEALTQALAVVPGGKALGVKLLKGPNPVYAVKLRVDGQVRQVLVDARTAQIVGD